MYLRAVEEVYIATRESHFANSLQNSTRRFKADASIFTFIFYLFCRWDKTRFEKARLLKAISYMLQNVQTISLHPSLSLIYALPAEVVGAPQMTLQPVSSIFLCSALPSGTWRTPGLSIHWRCLNTPFSVCLVFFPFHCALQDGFGQT